MSKGDYIGFTIILALLAGIIWFLVVMNNNDSEWNDKKYRISGKVVNIFLPVTSYHSKSGYYVDSDPHIVVYSDSLKRNVDIQVTWNCYVNMYVGKQVLFLLSKRDLMQ